MAAAESKAASRTSRDEHGQRRGLCLRPRGHRAQHANRRASDSVSAGFYGREGPERVARASDAIVLTLADPQTGVAPGLTRGRHMRSRYRCSMCSAIHINSRSWLRSSSTHEPSDPPLKVICLSFVRGGQAQKQMQATATFFYRPNENFDM